MSSYIIYGFNLNYYYYIYSSWTFVEIYKGWADILLTGETEEGAIVVTGLLTGAMVCIFIGADEGVRLGVITRDVGSIVGKAIHAAKDIDLVVEVVVPGGQSMHPVWPTDD